MSKQKIIDRFSWYYPVERYNAVLFAGITGFGAVQLGYGLRYKRLKAASLKKDIYDNELYSFSLRKRKATSVTE